MARKAVQTPERCLALQVLRLRGHAPRVRCADTEELRADSVWVGAVSYVHVVGHTSAERFGECFNFKSLEHFCLLWACLGHFWRDGLLLKLPQPRESSGRPQVRRAAHRRLRAAPVLRRQVRALLEQPRRGVPGLDRAGLQRREGARICAPEKGLAAVSNNTGRYIVFGQTTGETRRAGAAFSVGEDSVRVRIMNFIPHS